MNVYDESGHRVWQSRSTGPNIAYFYGPDGKLLSVFSLQLSNPQATYITYHQIYFGGTLLGSTKAYAGGEQAIINDRLGSKHQTYSYGTDVPNQTAQADASAVDFATYIDDDSSTGFEYANQRWYTAGYGRFLAADAYVASGNGNNPGNPASWNRYSYVQDDPANLFDPLDLFLIDPSQCPDPYTCPSNQLGWNLVQLWLGGYIALEGSNLASSFYSPSQVCDISLGISPHVFKTPANHAWVEVQCDVSVGGHQRTLFDTFIEGIPGGGLTVANGLFPIPAVLLTPIFTQGYPHYQTGYVYEEQKVSCVTVVNVLRAAENFPENILYLLLDSNSNTFASYLIEVAGLTPWYNNPPPATVGWGGDFVSVSGSPVPILHRVNPGGVGARH